MILVASQRGGGSQLARHLLNQDDNEQVNVHEVRGFMGDTVPDAFRESAALSKGTRCQQHLFSLSLSPPANENVSTETFENAIERAETFLNLNNQPRVIVFHEKEGRRHAHAVWSRIDTDSMTAINMPFYKEKLNRLGRDLYLHNEWELPKGFVDREHSNPLNFERKDWMQAKRTDNHPHVIKSVLRKSWHDSDDKTTFQKQLKQRGYALAKGDRRGYVAVDVHNEIYSLSRWLGENNKTLKTKLGDRQTLPSVDQAKQALHTRLKANVRMQMKAINEDYAQKQKPLIQHIAREKKHNTLAREQLKQQQEKRNRQAQQARQARFGKGLKGIWQRVTGTYRQIKQQNEQETLQAHEREKQETDALIFKQQQRRQYWQRQKDALEKKRQAELQALQDKTVSHFKPQKQEQLQQDFKKPAFQHIKDKSFDRQPDHGKHKGLSR